MATTNFEKLDTDTFEKIIYSDEKPCVVIFMRKTCHVCEEVVPMLEEVAPTYKDTCRFYAVDVEEQKNLFHRFSLKSVPQTLFFRDGEYCGKLVGLIEDDVLADKIAEVFGK